MSRLLYLAFVWIRCPRFLAFSLWLAVCGLPRPALGQQSSLPPATSVQPQLAATGLANASGLALDDEGTLYVSNYRTKGSLGRITVDGSASIWRTLPPAAAGGSPPHPAGLILDSEQRLIVADAGAGRLLRFSNDAPQAEILADRWQGTPFKSVTAAALDLMGNIYFVDARPPVQDQADSSVAYRYNIKTKQVDRLVGGLRRPQGIAVAPDQRHLVVADSGHRRILVFDLRSTQDPLRPRELFKLPPPAANGPPAYPAGLAFDDQARLYVALPGEGVIAVIDSRGAILRRYRAGGKQVTACHFHNGDLYTAIASKESIFRLPLSVKGFRYNGAQ